MKQKGFTLIELMIVIVIVGIVASLAFSALRGDPNHSSGDVGQMQGYTVPAQASTVQKCIDGKLFDVNGTIAIPVSTNGQQKDCVDLTSK